MINLRRPALLVLLFLTISSSTSWAQATDTTNDQSNLFKFGVYAVIAIGFIIYLRIASKNKSKLGINLNAVYCPKCETKQPRIRVPKNASQLLYGGTTCPKCQTNLDKYGNIIA